MKFLRTHSTPLLLALLCVMFYLIFAYDLDRTDFIKLITLYGALFFCTFIFIQKLKLDFWFLAFLGLGFRLVFIVAIPNLSQDFYRFLWDGRLMAQGLSPYLFTPDAYFETADRLRTAPGLLSGVEMGMNNATKIYRGMGALSASHYSNYPPINQFFFTVAALLSSRTVLGSVIMIRIIIILADIGILFYGKKLLKKFRMPEKNIFYYFLNPFIIIELTGNLHFEGVMLFLFILGLFLLFSDKWQMGAIIIGISISTKLLPLIFLPLFIPYFLKFKKKSSSSKNEASAQKKLLKFYAIIFTTVIFTFLPFYSSNFIQNYITTTALWFQNFEFNASVYYIIRWIGFQAVGWNVIATAGKILPVLVIIFILWLTFYRKINRSKELFVTMLLGVSFYYLMATTVHPWYIATPLLLSVFTSYKFPIVWSFVVMLSYSGYFTDGVMENPWLIGLEYIVLLSFAYFEMFTQSKNLGPLLSKT